MGSDPQSAARILINAIDCIVAQAAAIGRVMAVMCEGGRRRVEGVESSEAGTDTENASAGLVNHRNGANTKTVRGPRLATVRLESVPIIAVQTIVRAEP